MPRAGASFRAFLHRLGAVIGRPVEPFGKCSERAGMARSRALDRRRFLDSGRAARFQFGDRPATEDYISALPAVRPTRRHEPIRSVVSMLLIGIGNKKAQADTRLGTSQLGQTAWQAWQGLSVKPSRARSASESRAGARRDRPARRRWRRRAWRPARRQLPADRADVLDQLRLVAGADDER